MAALYLTALLNLLAWPAAPRVGAYVAPNLVMDFL